MPDPERPSVAPLSDSEADRLSERFTASWDDEPETGEGPATVPSASAAPPAAKPMTKQTLLGIAPIIVGPSQPPPAAPATAPKTAAPATASQGSGTLVVSAPPPVSSPDASAVARGLTTPSKPYIPKDDPSTPAVVVSDAALAAGAAQPRSHRTRTAQTIPAQRAPSIAQVSRSRADATLDDTTPPARLRPSRLPLLLGGGAAAAVVIAALALTGGEKQGANASRGQSAVAEPTVAAEPAAAEPAAAEPAASRPPGTTQPEPPATVSEAVVPPPTRPTAEVRSEPPVEAAPGAKKAKSAKSAKRPNATATAARRAPPPKPAPKVDSKPSAGTFPPAVPAAEPPAPPSPAKGVIVRDTPF